MNWQPINTAPTDGTSIIVYQPAFEKHGIKSWQRERMAVVSWGYNGWCVDHVSGPEYDTEFDFEALTHWMPLPEAPK